MTDVPVDMQALLQVMAEAMKNIQQRQQNLEEMLITRQQQDSASLSTEVPFPGHTTPPLSSLTLDSLASGSADDNDTKSTVSTATTIDSAATGVATVAGVATSSSSSDGRKRNRSHQLHLSGHRNRKTKKDDRIAWVKVLPLPLSVVLGLGDPNHSWWTCMLKCHLSLLVLH